MVAFATTVSKLANVQILTVKENILIRSKFEYVRFDSLTPFYDLGNYRLVEITSDRI